MKEKNILLRVGGSKLSLRVYPCNFFNKIVGLMFSRRENAKALLFKFDNDVNMSIHSFFVFYPFLALWLDKDNKLIEKRIVYPWKIHISPVKNYRSMIEIPINRRYKRILHSIVEKKDLKRILSSNY